MGTAIDDLINRKAVPQKHEAEIKSLEDKLDILAEEINNLRSTM